jgi:hypothetical protein
MEFACREPEMAKASQSCAEEERLVPRYDMKEVDECARVGGKPSVAESRLVNASTYYDHADYGQVP